MVITSKYTRFFAIVTASILGFISQASANTLNYYNLVFSNPVQSTNRTDPNLGAYYSGLSYDFRNVAPNSGVSIDLRVSVTINNSPDYGFVGSYPNFNASPTNTNGDLGFTYQYNGNRNVNGGNSITTVGGIDYTLTFYVGNGNFSTEIAVPNLRFLMYDVDGETNQSESIRVYQNDGFIGYQLPSIGGITQSYNASNKSHSFTGPGSNRAETDASGAFILHYQNTSKIRFTMEASTRLNGWNANSVNQVFSAIDGDLSMIDPQNFNQFVAIPEPSSALLFFCGGLLLIFRRRI